MKSDALKRMRVLWTANDGTVTMRATTRFDRRSRKNSSSPRCDQRGVLPPVVDTGHFPAPGAARGTTYTSKRPVSFVTYASHLPSGETAGEYSARGVATSGTG